MKNKYRKEGWRGRGYNFMPYPINRDNKEIHNVSSGSSGYRGCTIRVPSLKRNKNIWRKFYSLFPSLKGLKSWNGSKLKRI